MEIWLVKLLNRMETPPQNQASFFRDFILLGFYLSTPMENIPDYDPIKKDLLDPQIWHKNIATEKKLNITGGNNDKINFNKK